MDTTKKRIVPTILVLLLMLSLVDCAMANFVPPPPGTPYGLIYIKSDGTVSPSNLPISRSGNTYTLTSNITNYGLKVECNNITIDGAGFAIQAIDWYAPTTGITLENRNGVTIKNMVIAFSTGILLNSSSNNIIEKNTIMNSNDGISILNRSTNNTFSQNQLTGSVFLGHSIYISESPGNKFRNNTVINGQRSYFWPSTNKLNFYIECSSMSPPTDFVEDIDSSNILDGKPICYWIDQQDKVVPSEVSCVVLVNCSGITVEDLNLTNNGQGLLLVSTTNSTIKNCEMSSNNQGVVLLDSSNNTFIGNNITKNVYGAAFYSSHNLFLLNCFSNNERESANFQDGYMNTIDTSNTVNGAPLCYWVNEQDRTVPSNVGYVFLVNCSRILVQNLTIKNQTQGLCLVSTSDSLIANNNITDNEGGICLNESSNNKIVRNQITGNLANSVYLTKSSGNIVAENQITNGYIGLYVANSTENTFSRNNVTDNSYNGIDFFGSSNNNLVENRVENQGRAGISLEYASNNNRIAGNNVSNNKFCSVDLNNAQNNTFYHNNFVITITVRNGYYLTHQILDINAQLPIASPIAVLSQNKWDNGVEGNYWSDYNGSDQNSDGIGDTPYVPADSNSSNTRDQYPLTSTLNLPFEPQLTVLSPENKGYTSENVPFNFVVNKIGLQVSYSLDLQGDSAVNGNTTLNNLTEGIHNLLVWTTDASGTPANFQVVNFNITKETAPTQSPQPSPNETRAPSNSSNFSFMDLGLVGLVLAIIIGVGLVVYIKKQRGVKLSGSRA
jgi:parallel beta-helix repeat protein